MPPGQKIMYITWDLLFSERYAVRKPDIYKVRTADPSCLCIFRYVKLRVYKHLLKINLWGFCTSLISCQFVLSFSLSLPLIFRLIFGQQRFYAFTFLPGLLRPTREGGQGGATSAIQASACGLREQSKCIVLRLY